jgi:hypothetical protein
VTLVEEIVLTLELTNLTLLDFLINTPEQIPELVRLGVEGLIETVATDAQLQIETEPGISVLKKIFGNASLIWGSGTKIGDLKKKG